MSLKSLLRIGRVKLPHLKSTAGLAAVRMPAPSEVFIPLMQGIGAPAVPVVKAGDSVYVGTVIGEAGGYVGAPVHSSVSGKVKKIDTYIMSNGKGYPMVIIESDGNMTPDASVKAPTVTDFESFMSAVAASGVVGLGGAGFPTAVKLDAHRRGLIKTVILNAAECEPYITSDTRTMLDLTEYVKAGINLLEGYISPERIIIGIEANKRECIEKLRREFASDERVSVDVLPSTYPQGAEKVLIYNTTGLTVPEGKLPSDVGCLVMNITTLTALAKYIESGMPIVEKCVTVDGSAVKEPKNVIAPIGTRVCDVIEFAGGLKCEAGKAIFGGPMMGVAMVSLDEPIMKTTNALTILDRKDSKPYKTTACIHCGRCVSACPMGLTPTVFAKAMNVPELEDRASILDGASINLCIECGSCSYVCPAKRPLVQYNKLGKADSRAYAAAMKENAQNNEKTVGEKGEK